MSVRQFLTAALVATGILPLLLFGLAFYPILKSHIGEDISIRSEAMLRSLAAQAGSSLLDGTRKDLPALLILAGDLSARSSDDEAALLRSFSS